MYQGPETGGDRRRRWRLLYADEEITITSWYVERDGVRIAVAELRDVMIHRTYRYPIFKVAAVLGGVEAVIVGGAAVAADSPWTILAGLVSTATVALGALADYRRNPRFMSIEANIRGRYVVLYSTSDQQRFGQVWRALIRAVEDSRDPHY
jgi:hypothetical protein